jgi:hypothetical protein
MAASRGNPAVSPPKQVGSLPGDGSLATWVMVGHVPGDDDEPWSYRTGAVKTVRAVRANTGEVDALIDESWGAWPLSKASGRSFASTVLIGRAANNDITLNHTSVSKLHARVRLHAGALYLQDAGSSNGTLVNGARLQGDEELLLESGDLVRFGAVVFQVFSPAHMTAVLERLRGG